MHPHLYVVHVSRGSYPSLHPPLVIGLDGLGVRWRPIPVPGFPPPEGLPREQRHRFVEERVPNVPGQPIRMRGNSSPQTEALLDASQPSDHTRLDRQPAGNHGRRTLPHPPASTRIHPRRDSMVSGTISQRPRLTKSCMIGRPRPHPQIYPLAKGFLIGPNITNDPGIRYVQKPSDESQ